MPQHSDVKNAAPRIAVYTHDTFGMGHVRRCMNIISCLAGARPDAAILLVTGSNALGALESRPANVDFVKLPTIAPTGEAEDRPPHLPIATGELIRIRSRMLRSLLKAFAPHAFLVDNFALGARKELLPSLEMLKDLPTRVVLGLRDISDAPETIRRRWPRDGVTEALENLYDVILVYGEQRVFDIGEAYDLSPAIRAKIRYCGYVGRQAAAPADDAALAALGVRAPFVLLTVGGGGDGLPLVSAFMDARRRLPGYSALVVTGPLMGPGPRAEAGRLAGEAERTVVAEFLPDLPRYMARAEAVISMGGYNSAVELIANRCRAVIVPRNWRYGQHGKGTAAGVEMEQQMRAEHLARAGLATLVPPESLDGDSLASAILEAIAKPPPTAGAFSSEGASTAARIILNSISRHEEHV